MSKRKHKNIFHRPPAICLKCGPADKMAIVPKACERCGFRATANEKAGKEMTQKLIDTERAAQLTWEVSGRCLDDMKRDCPVAIFGKELLGWICEVEIDEGKEEFICNTSIEQRGDDIHPHWRCWAAWLGFEMVNGSYSSMMLEARRLSMKKKQEVLDAKRKKDSESNPS